MFSTGQNSPGRGGEHRIYGGIGHAMGGDPRQAAKSCAQEALQAANGAAEAALLMVTPQFSKDLSSILEVIQGELGTSQIVGATSYGVLANGRQYEQEPALGLLAFGGLEACGFLIPELAELGEDVGLEIASRIAEGLPGGVCERDLVVLFPDPQAANPASLQAGLNEALNGVTVIGAGCATTAQSSALQWCGSEVQTGALSGLVLRGNRPPRVGLAQSVGPVSEWLTVTRTRGHWISELDGRPALEVYRAKIRGPLAEDLTRAAEFVLAAIPVEGAVEGAAGEEAFLVRNIAGISVEQNSFALAEAVSVGDRIGLVVRESNAARQDLKEVIAGTRSPDAALGIYLNCCARGKSLFGIADLEAAYLHSELEAVPTLGMFGAFEIGPVARRSQILTYTGVLALVG